RTDSLAKRTDRVATGTHGEVEYEKQFDRSDDAICGIGDALEGEMVFRCIPDSHPRTAWCAARRLGARCQGCQGSTQGGEHGGHDSFRHRTLRETANAGQHENL